MAVKCGKVRKQAGKKLTDSLEECSKNTETNDVTKTGAIQKQE